MVAFFCCGRCIGRFCYIFTYQCVGHIESSHGFPIMGVFFLEFSRVFCWVPEIPPRLPKRIGIQLYFFRGPFWLDECVGKIYHPENEHMSTVKK